MKKSVIAVLFFGCWFMRNHSTAIAQQLPSNDVYVANPLTRTMKFSIICDYGDQKESTKHELKPQSGELYKCVGSESSTLLRVVTGHKQPVLVKLEPKKRYEFYWNAAKSQWDVREIAPRT